MTGQLYLEELIDLFEKSKQAYQQYIRGGKTFRHAQVLKFYNGSALDLLVKKGLEFDVSLQEDIASLIQHYREWSLRWEKLAASKVFKPDEVFAFANDVVFPKHASINLENHLNGLK